MHNLLETGKTIAIGTAGIGTSEIANNLLMATPTDISSTVNVITQLVVAVSTLIALFKKKRNKTK